MAPRIILSRAALCVALATLAACGDSGGSTTTSTDSGSTSSSSAVNGAVVALSSSKYTVPASSATAVIMVNRSGTSTGTTSADYTTVNGTATPGTDYNPTSGTLTWADGDTSSKAISVRVAAGGNGEFGVQLTSVVGAADFGSPTSATVALSTANSIAGSTSSTAASTGSSSSAAPAAAVKPAAASTTSSGGVTAASFYVAPGGSDSNAGSISAPFLTLTKAQTAMRASSTKSTYVRAGTYNVSRTLALTSADNGETWEYYPQDGANSAVLNGGNSVSGGIIAIEGGSNITINGLKIQNFVDYGILGGGGPHTNWGTVAEDTGNTIENCDVGFNTVTTWQSAGISLSGPNSTIANNYVHDVGSQGIAAYAYYAGQSINGTVIKNNVVLNAVLRQSDGGAIYVNMYSGIQSDYVTITNNYVANYGSASTNSVHGIYMDDCASNVTVTGNLVGPPTTAVGTTGGYNGIASILIHSGNNNTISGNIVDLGSSGHVGTVIWYYGGDPVDVGMHGNTFTGNLVISKIAGTLNALFSGINGRAYWQSTNDPKGYAYAINGNAYWNYAAGGAVFSTGNVASDSSPTIANLLLSGPTYAIAGGSPAYNTPVNFQAIVGGWGPPGYNVPTTGIAHSSP
jgi:hypothetical protein